MRESAESANDANRYLLVRPLGGLNDVLCQIEYARMLASDTRRHLIIQSETANPELKHRFGQAFDSIFIFADETDALNVSDLSGILASNPSFYPSCYPDLQELLHISLSEISDGKIIKCRLDKVENKSETLLIHESDGGGLLSSYLLGRIALKSGLEDIARKAVSILPSKSLGLHFRNGDYTSDKSELGRFVSMARTFETIVLATDDTNLVKYLQSAFPERKYIFARDLIPRAESLSPTELAVVELLLLGACNHLGLVPLSEIEDVEYSGFGLLAKQLWVVRKAKTEGILRLAFSLARFSRPKKRWLRLNTYQGLLARTNFRVIVSQLLNTRGVYLQLEKMFRARKQ